MPLYAKRVAVRVPRPGPARRGRVHILGFAFSTIHLQQLHKSTPQLHLLSSHLLSSIQLDPPPLPLKRRPLSLSPPIPIRTSPHFSFLFRLPFPSPSIRTSHPPLLPRCWPSNSTSWASLRSSVCNPRPLVSAEEPTLLPPSRHCLSLTTTRLALGPPPRDPRPHLRLRARLQQSQG